MRKLTPLALLALTVIFSAVLQGQVSMGGGAQASPISSPMAGNWGTGQRGVSVSIGSFQRPFHHHFFPQPIFFAEPWFTDYPESVPPPPQVIVLQQPAATVPEPKEEPRPITPLLIELQGGRYVRSGGLEIGRDRRAVVNADQGTTIFPRNNGATPSVSDVRAILVFRDQHREQVESYAIVGSTIYVNSNYWSSGAWTKKVLLTDLDLPSTTSLNQQRGVKFTLPAGPNEVVTRP